MDEANKEVVTVTARAATEMFRLLVKRGTPDAFVRFGVRGGGCTGFTYAFEFSDEKRKKDEVLLFGEIRLLIDPKSMQLLTGTVIDFETGMRGHGFQFLNPNIRSNCGCGESFSI